MRISTVIRLKHTIEQIGGLRIALEGGIGGEDRDHLDGDDVLGATVTTEDPVDEILLGCLQVCMTTSYYKTWSVWSWSV